MIKLKEKRKNSEFVSLIKPPKKPRKNPEPVLKIEKVD